MIETVNSDDTIDRPTNPFNYQIRFNNDGSYNAQVDCNRASGSYYINGDKLEIQEGISTLIACPAGSMEKVFSQDLFSAAIYFWEDGQLFIAQMADGGTMRFVEIQVSIE